MAPSIAWQQAAEQLVDLFPYLGSRDSFQVVSPSDEDYNCIAFAAGRTDRKWWPIAEYEFRSGNVYWPPEAPCFETIEAFEAAFESLGYESCHSDEHESEHEKVALYAKDGVPTHAARQDPHSGWWLSKMGDHVDIQHQRADSLTGSLYGEVCRYLKRTLPPPE